MSLKDTVIPKIKKYLFLISVIIFLSTFSHILYSYLYSGAKIIPIEGGMVTEGIIGDFPHLNPLVPSSDYNKYIVGILYRSLLKYDYEEGKIVSDIASCDIKDLSYIECFLSDTPKWSDGTPITIADIKTTYDTILTTDVNPVLTSLLSETEIEVKEDSIIFNNGKSDVNFLNVLFQPIVSQGVLNEITSEEMKEKFPLEGALYSGYFQVDSVSKDETLGISKLILKKNESFFDNPFILDKMVFNIFQDATHFLKHIDTVNIFNDKLNLLGETIPRLEVFSYTMPQYFSLFLNVENIENKDLRTFILSSIERENILKVAGEKNYESVNNPYFLSGTIDKEVKEKNIVQLMEGEGYYRSSALINKFLKNIEKEEEKTATGETLEKEKKETLQEKVLENPEEETEDETLVFIISPTKEKYNFVSEDDILLQGKVEDTAVEKVYVNDYALQGFSQGDEFFYYRLKEEGYDSIKEGENHYAIYFEKNGKKELKEEVVYYFYRDAEKLAQAKSAFLKAQEALKNKETESEEKMSIEEEKEESQEEKFSETQKEELSFLEGLDTELFYNEEGEPFALDFIYLDTDPSAQAVVEAIESSLRNYGILVNSISVLLTDLVQIVRSEEKNYDMVFAGINLGFFDNLFPYFHSSQIKSGYNFSNFKKLSLDILLEELKGSILASEEEDETKKEIIDILQQESIMKTLYTPRLDLLVDKSIKNFSFPSNIKDDSLRIDALRDAYISEKKIMNFEGKSFFGFISYLFSSLL